MKGTWLTAILAVCLLIVGCVSEEPDSNEPLSFSVKEGDYQTKLVVSSDKVGPNTFTWSITDGKNQPITTGDADLHFSMVGTMDHGKSELALQNQQNGTWTGEGPNLMMEGIWLLRLVWTDEQGKSHPFEYTVSAKIE